MAKQAKKPDESIIRIEDANVKYATVVIEGDGDLVLNKMNASNERALLSDDRKAQSVWEAQHNNKWEQIITSIHWRDGIPCEDTNAECTEEMFFEMLEKNAPCITAFGLKKSWGQALRDNKFETYANKFNNAVNIVAPCGLVPITFAEWKLDTRLMTPKRGSPVTTRLSHFQGWRAEIPIAYTDHVYTTNEIITIINYAGFGIGIGSGRSSGYGRYHVVDVK